MIEITKEMDRNEREFVHSLSNEMLVSGFATFSKVDQYWQIAEYYKAELLSRLNQKGD